MSYQNAILYSRAMPMAGDKDESDDKPLYDESKDACNTDLFTDLDDEEVVYE